MSEIGDLSTLYKEQYGPGPVNLLPLPLILQRLYPYAKGEQPEVGGPYVENLDLEFNHGFTLAGNAVNPELNAGIAAVNLKARVTPSQIIGVSAIGYRDIMRTDKAGKKAFTSAVKKNIVDLSRGMRRNIEISMMWGQSENGIGVVAADISATPGIIHLTPATTAPGLWMGSQNMAIDVYQSDGVTLRQGGLIVSKISSVDPDDFSVTVTGTSTGIVTGDIIRRLVEPTGGAADSECLGIGQILRNTGEIFEVDASEHDLWQANYYDFNGGRMTVSGILEGVDKGVIKGLDGDVNVIIPSRAYARMNDDYNSLGLARAEYNPKKGEQGVESLVIRGQTGLIRVIPHTYMMQGEAWAIPASSVSSAKDPEDALAENAGEPVKRIGSCDMIFGMPGAQGGTDTADIFVQSGTNGSVQIRNYTDQAPFINKPGHCTLFTGITYPS